MNGVDDEQRAPEASQDEPVSGAPADPEVTPREEAVSEVPGVAEVAEPAEPEPAVEARDELRPEPATPSGRWLVAQASATLRTVASQNCACFGRSGVPRYGVAESGSAPSSGALTAALVMRSGRETKLACDTFPMRLLRSNDREMVWAGFDAARQLQVLWVWDFYRIQSHVALRVALPDEGALPDLWRDTLDAMRAAGQGDSIELDVESACGDFDQTHTLARGAAEWEKGSG